MRVACDSAGLIKFVERFEQREIYCEVLSVIRMLQYHFFPRRKN